MNKTDQKKQFMLELGERFSHSGFQLRKSHQDFIRVVPGGKQSIHVAFIDHSDDFDITVDFAIRFDALEDLMNETETGLTAKQKADTFSIGVEFGNWMRHGQHRWSVDEGTGIEKLCNLVHGEVHQEIMNYFDAFGDMRAVLKALRCDSEIKTVLSAIEIYRSKNFIALNFLLNKQDLQEEIQSEREFLEKKFPEELDDFEEFVSFINSKSTLL